MLEPSLTSLRGLYPLSDVDQVSESGSGVEDSNSNISRSPGREIGVATT